MAQNATTHELAGGPVPAPGAVERTGSVDSALDRLWHLLTSMKLALLLILGFAALTLVGTLLMQMPAGVAEDPQARASWLAEARPRYGGWTDVMDRLQLFTIFTSVWLRAIGAVSYTHLTLPTIYSV